MDVLALAFNGYKTLPYCSGSHNSLHVKLCFCMKQRWSTIKKGKEWKKLIFLLWNFYNLKLKAPGNYNVEGLFNNA